MPVRKKNKKQIDCPNNQKKTKKYNMKHIKLFENFNNDISEEIDNWIEANNDYISASSLEDKLKELIGDDDIESSETIEKNSGGNEYGENWSTKVICIKYKGQELMKVCVNSSGVYDFGKNSIMFKGLPKDKVVEAGFGTRFFFDKTLV